MTSRMWSHWNVLISKSQIISEILWLVSKEIWLLFNWKLGSERAATDNSIKTHHRDYYSKYIKFIIYRTVNTEINNSNNDMFQIFLSWFITSFSKIPLRNLKHSFSKPMRKEFYYWEITLITDAQKKEK